MHGTRRTTVTKVLRGGANVMQIAATSGHQALAIVMGYEHLAAAASVELAERLLADNAQRK